MLGNGEGKVVQLRKIYDYRLGLKFVVNDYKTMARCLGNRNDAMDEIDTSALKYLSLSAENY